MIDDFEDDPYSTLEQDAGYILSNNLQDRSVRSGLSLAGWKPRQDMKAQAVEWWEFDFEYGQTPVRYIDKISQDVKLIRSRKRAPRNLPLSTT